jgi:hypothetical protein
MLRNLIIDNQIKSKQKKLGKLGHVFLYWSKVFNE